MKRIGGIFEIACTEQSLYAAYERASRRKHGHRAQFQFARNLGTNIAALQHELLEGDYRPRPLNAFWATASHKRRLIEAPAFRDLVVQHALYAQLRPIFDRHFISTSYACRVGKGTHAAANWLQAAMRRAEPTAWTLHVDVRKFFYSIDRDVLDALLRRVIKCPRTAELLRMFAMRDADRGVPIGNLLSQLFANVYLNSLDQFCKRALRVREYARYMDDAIMIAPDGPTAHYWLRAIRDHLASPLHLEISHYCLQPISRGASFVGFRTWRSRRFVRKNVITDFRRDARRGCVAGVISRLGHARHTATFGHLLRTLRNHHDDLYLQLPESFRRLDHARGPVAA